MANGMLTSPQLTVPGWGGSGANHWQTHWERDFGETRIVLGDWCDPSRANWIAALDRAVVSLARRDPRPPVLVAHSLGCLIVAEWARTTRHPIRAALLVAPADVDREACSLALRGFGPVPRHPLPFSSLVVTSDNDPHVSVARADEIATAWGSEFYVIQSAGHINADSGHGPWPEGHALLERLLRRTQLSRAG